MMELKKRLHALGVQEGRMDRRQFIQLALGAGLTVASAEMLFVNAALAAPKSGGSARFGMARGSTTDTLDPATYNDSYTGTVAWGAMSNSLTEVDERGEIQPDLAESFESSDGAKKWVFRLRKGVTFHNGKSVTADDVVASLQYHRGAGSKSGGKPLLAPISGMKADGADVIVFTFESGNADFPYVLSDFHFPILPSQDGKVDWASGVRTGPFVLDEFRPGISARLSKNPGYHKSGKPYLDHVEFLVLADMAARTNALLSGEVEYIEAADLKTLSFLKQNPDIDIEEVTGYGHCVMPMNVTVAPFDNPDVRLALKWAIRRQEIVDKIFFGHATVANDNPLAPSIKYAIDPQPTFEFNPDRAREHLRKAGLESLTVDLHVADAPFAGAIDAALLVKASAAECGITVNVIREPNDGYWENVVLKKPWCADYWSGRPTPDWMFSTAYAADAPWNETYWKSPRFNELLVKARSETDPDKRAAMYAEMQQINHDDNGQIVLAFNNLVTAKSKRLGHGALLANWPNDGYKIAERWWVA